LKTPGRILIVVLMLQALFTACVKEYSYITDPEKTIFNFSVSESQRQKINESRGIKFELTDPTPDLIAGGLRFRIDHFRIRGESTLNFERKCFSVNMDLKIPVVDPVTGIERKFERFKLISGVFDYTYIENRTAEAVFRKIGLWPLFDFYTEVKLNNHTQGLYHFIEDPEAYYTENQNSSFVLRRGYNHSVKSFFSNPMALQPASAYPAMLNRIYSAIKDYSGQALFDTLNNYIDLPQYFRKIGIDMLLQNGDYTDEIYFYTKVVNGKEIFGVLPWDDDDLFASQPHEIGRSWAVGTVFGKRSYSGKDAIKAEIGDKLIWSIEDDLDYQIAKDSILYQEYLKTLSSVMQVIDDNAIDSIFTNTEEHLAPFFENDSIVDQTRFDVTPSNKTLFLDNLQAKKQLILDRRNYIISELEKQYTLRK